MDYYSERIIGASVTESITQNHEAMPCSCIVDWNIKCRIRYIIGEKASDHPYNQGQPNLLIFHFQTGQWSLALWEDKVNLMSFFDKFEIL